MNDILDTTPYHDLIMRAMQARRALAAEGSVPDHLAVSRDIYRRLGEPQPIFAYQIPLPMVTGLEIRVDDSLPADTMKARERPA